jgi:hypothetical protein
VSWDARRGAGGPYIGGGGWASSSPEARRNGARRRRRGASLAWRRTAMRLERAEALMAEGMARGLADAPHLQCGHGQNRRRRRGGRRGPLRRGRGTQRGYASTRRLVDTPGQRGAARAVDSDSTRAWARLSAWRQHAILVLTTAPHVLVPRWSSRPCLAHRPWSFPYT